MSNHTNTKSIKYFLAFAALALFLTQVQTVKAQDVSAGVDLYSTYVWRGVAYSGPSIQPYVEVGSGGFAIGAWGSQGIDASVADGTVGFQEMDLYAGYSFDFGLSLGVTDYYYPGTAYFEDDSHAFELNAGFEAGDLSLSGNYIFAGGGSVGDDIYFELGYSVGKADLFVGGGDGWHTTDTDFSIVNVGIATTKDIIITESFTVPLSGAVILNPDTEQFYVVVGLSL